MGIDQNNRSSVNPATETAHYLMTTEKRYSFRHYLQLFGIEGVILFLRESRARKGDAFQLRLSGVPHPIHARFRTTDLAMIWQVFFSKEYDFNIEPKPAVIVDAGANIGAAAVYFANKYPDARIFAIEPEEGNFRLLQQNVNAYSNITPIHAALWSKECTLEIANAFAFEREAAYMTHEVSNGVADGCIRKNVQAMHMPGILGQYNINYVDLLKIDIEGAEKEVFENQPDWLSKVSVIAIELHDRFKPGCSRSFYRAVEEFPIEGVSGENTVVAREGIEIGFPDRMGQSGMQ